MYDGFSHVIVGFDGSQHAQRALEWGVDAARRRRTPLLVMVAGGDSPLITPGDELADEWANLAEDLLARSGLPDHVVEISKSRPAEALVRASGPSVLTVVGSHGHGRVAGLLLGSVSQHVARHSTGPVVVVREQADLTESRIVVGVDGSAASLHALEFACAEAASSGRPVVALYGWRVSNLRGSPLAGDAPPRGMVEIWESHRWMAEAVAGVAEKYPDVPLEREAVAVPAVRVLTDASAHAAMIVVGSRGRGAFTELLLGSVSQAILNHARCPVAVVR